MASLAKTGCISTSSTSKSRSWRNGKNEKAILFCDTGTGFQGTEKKIQQIQAGNPVECFKPSAFYGCSVSGLFCHVPKIHENYPVYYLTGFILWNFFTTATNTAMTALADNQTLILQVKFPREVFPFARVYTAFCQFPLFPYRLWDHSADFWNTPVGSSFPVSCDRVFYFPVFLFGMGYLLSVLYVFFGDVRHLYSVFLTLWMYLSALFYPLELLPETMQRLIWQNPIYNFIAAARDCILYGTLPRSAVMIRIFVWGIGMYGAGKFVFQKSQSKVIQKL